MQFKQINGNEKWATLAVGTTGNSYFNLSTFAERVESTADNPTGISIDPNRAYVVEITGSQAFYAVLSHATDTAPSATAFQFVGDVWSFIRAGRADTDNKDIYLHALTGSGTAHLGISAYPLDSLRTL